MITLRDKLYESLLDDEDKLIDNDDKVVEHIFYEECKKLIPNLNEKYMYDGCKYNNEKISIKSQIYISSTGIKKQILGPENIFFRGFSICSDIEYLYWLVVSKPNFMGKFNSKKYSISKINKYPMNIKDIHWMSLNSWTIIDYCPNIKIDNIKQFDIRMANDVVNDIGLPDSDVFDFFKCVKHIDSCNIEGDMYSLISNRTNPVIPAGLIKNINADKLTLHIGHILQNAHSKVDLNNTNKPLFDLFIDDLYKYNKINQIVINTSFRHGKRDSKSYTVEKSKSKTSKYVLKPLK